MQLHHHPELACSDGQPGNLPRRGGFSCIVLTMRITIGTSCRWHDDFTAFKAGVHDLEVMLENVMQLALDSTPSLPGMLELLEGFQAMAKRTAVKRAVERHMSEFYRRFMGEINAVKKHFDTLRRTPTTSPMLPHYAGAAR